jgi:hypothetical protein
MTTYSARLDACAPAAVQEALPGSEQRFVSDKADDHNHQHDAQDLIHGMELAPIMQQMTEAEAGENGNVDFCCMRKPSPASCR